MQVPSYAWPYKSGALGVFLTIFTVVAYDLNRGDLGAGFMVGYVTALAVTVVEFLRTRHSYEWTWLKFLNAAGALVLVALATTGMFRLCGLVVG